MNEDSKMQLCESEVRESILIEALQEIPDQDDRYPGSFFRVPGVPIPGQTTWSLN